MTANELIDQIQPLLRLAIASRLKIAKSDYDGSMDTRTTVNHYLTNVMALGYNPDLETATQEICDFRFFGEELDEEKLEKIRNEMEATNNTFPAEVGAYAKAHEMLRQGISPDEVLNKILPLVLIDDAYKS